MSLMEAAMWLKAAVKAWNLDWRIASKACAEAWASRRASSRAETFKMKVRTNKETERCGRLPTQILTCLLGYQPVYM
jgi:hypothetical protein